MGTGQADGQCKQVGRGNCWKKIREKGCTSSLFVEGVVVLAGMTRALNCTRLAGAAFEQ